MKDKHIEVFKQEAFELLEIIESCLLDLETNPENEKLIGEIFRALHTLKGSGGMFGYAGVASFVHNIETVYQKIRNNELKVTADIIDITLKARDQLFVMITNDDRGPLVENEIVKEILIFFNKYIPHDNNSSKKITKYNQVLPGRTNHEKNYRITFNPSIVLLTRGIRITGLLNELSEMGEAYITPLTDSIPLLNDIDPEKLYTSWNIDLRTEKNIAELNEVFAFVEDECEIEIKEIDFKEPGKNNGADFAEAGIKKILFLLHQHLDILQNKARYLLQS